MKKRFLAVLLCICMVVAMLPTVAFAADPDYTMDFSVTGSTSWGEFSEKDFSTTDAHGTGWSWSYADKTLTLSGLSFTTSADIAIKLPTGTKLVLTGTNTVTSTFSTDGLSCGIFCVGAMTVSGSGSLTVQSGDSNSNEIGVVGMYVETDLLMNSGTLNANGGEGVQSVGLYSGGNITVTGGTLTCTGGTAREYGSAGVFAVYDITVSGTGTLTGKSGTATGNCSNGVNSDGGNIIVNGGTLIATGGSVTGSGSSHGVFAEESIKLSGGKTTATGYTGALKKAPELTGVTAQVSTSINGTDPVAYASNESVGGKLWFQAITVSPAVPTTYTYNTPDPITQNGVTATVSFDKASPQEADAEITATVTLTGTAAAAGTHTINLNSTKASLTGTAQNITVTAGQTSFTVPNTYSFTVPTEDVDDLTLEHTFEGMGAIRLGTAGIPRGDKVYFGRYTEGSITYDVPWIVLGGNVLSETTVTESTSTGTKPKVLPLMSEYLLGASAFRDTSKGNGYYDGSTLQTAMKSIYDGFDSKEKTAVADTTLTGGSMHSSQGELSEQKLFPLSSTEAGNLNRGSDILKASYISNPTGSAGWWWLRSAPDLTSAFCVSEDGYITLLHIIASPLGVRPAFNLNLDSVLFTSAAVSGKSSGTIGASALNPVSTTTPAEWKLTLLDVDRNFDAATTAVNGDVLTITYSGATLGTNEYISAIIKDSSGNITRYGRLKNTTVAADASGTVNIDLSGVAMATTDKLYVFSEQYNGGTTDDTKLTDYASALVEVSQTKNAYAIINDLMNITSNNTATYRLMSDTADYAATLTADTNYTLPATITVEVGDTPLAVGTDYTYSGGSLTIPEGKINGDIEITAKGVLPVTTYALTVNLNGGNAGTTGGDYAENDRINIDAGTKANYSFNGWTSSNGGAFENANSASTTFTMPGNATTITANWSYNGGGSGSSTDYYTLTFDTGGGSDITSTRISEYTTVDLTLSKYIPTYEGHEFTGWYADESLTDKITSIRLTKNTTIYAGWKLTHENPQTGMGNPFTDVKESDWFFEDVMFVYGNKFMVGTSATTFSPNDTTTRAMVVTILWRMEGSPKVTGGNGFTDVSDGKYYTDAVTWAKQNDIVRGYSNTLFGPNEPVTREQLAAFFYRYSQYKGYDTTISGSISSFKDKDKVSDWAVDAMKWAVGYGVIQGKPGNLLDPQGDATRAQLAAMLHRLIEKNGLVEGVTPTGLMGWINPKGLDTPKTGDNTNAAFFGGMFMLSAMALAALLYLRKRKNSGDTPTPTAA